MKARPPISDAAQQQWRIEIRKFLGESPAKEDKQEAIRQIQKDSGYFLSEYQFDRFLDGMSLKKANFAEDPSGSVPNPNYRPKRTAGESAVGVLDGIIKPFEVLFSLPPIFWILGAFACIMILGQCSKGSSSSSSPRTAEKQFNEDAQKLQKLIEKDKRDPWR